MATGGLLSYSRYTPPDHYEAYILTRNGESKFQRKYRNMYTTIFVLPHRHPVCYVYRGTGGNQILWDGK